MNKYDDIIDLPHFHDVDFPEMPLNERAGQFSPFDALGICED